MSRYGVVPTMWPSAMTLTLDFQGQVLKMLYLRNGRVHWHGTKGMRVHRMLDSHYDFKIWLHSWPWPWIFKVKYRNCCISGMWGSTHLELKGCELDMMLDAQWYWPWAVVAWQIDRPSNWSMWNSYSFQPVALWMGCSFTDLGAEGCCCSLNALF